MLVERDAGFPGCHPYDMQTGSGHNVAGSDRGFSFTRGLIE